MLPATQSTPTTPATSELYNSRQLAGRHPHLLNEHRVAWAVRNRQKNGLRHWENPRDVLLTLQPEQFEFLIAALYRALGYEVLVTQRSRDGGVDVEATRAEPGARERVLIQCKLYAGAVGVAPIRELRGIVAERQANKGTVIATGGFTRPARAFASHNAMIELLDFGDLNLMLNRSFGARWPNAISYLIREEQTAALRRSDNRAQV